MFELGQLLSGFECVFVFLKQLFAVSAALKGRSRILTASLIRGYRYRFHATVALQHAHSIDIFIGFVFAQRLYVNHVATVIVFDFANRLPHRALTAFIALVFRPSRLAMGETCHSWQQHQSGD
jgi:hypothetical protein